MKAAVQRTSHILLALRQAPQIQRRCATLHTTAVSPAQVYPGYGTGPPPAPPCPAPSTIDPITPSETIVDARNARRRKQAVVLRDDNRVRSASISKQIGNDSGKGQKKEGLLRKRFWKHADVKEVDGEFRGVPFLSHLEHPRRSPPHNLPFSAKEGCLTSGAPPPPPLLENFPSWAAQPSTGQSCAPIQRRFTSKADILHPNLPGALEIHLDTRPIRRSNTKQIVRIPLTKPYLAYALALEWDHLLSAQEATKHHLVPLTSLVCRALDIADDDVAHISTPDAPHAPVRVSIATVVLRYFDTDSLLCWAPHPDSDAHDSATGPSLRETQEATARPVIEFLTSRVWPGTEIGAVLDGLSLMPHAQAAGVRDVVRGWVLGLSEWELAGLERGVLASKGLLGAARLVAEWSEGKAGVSKSGQEEVHEKFGAEQAAHAASLEVDWQTRRWGEVEDTHDVEKADLRRQLGSVILLVSGIGRQNPVQTAGGR